MSIISMGVPHGRKCGFTQSYGSSYGGIVPVFIEFTGSTSSPGPFGRGRGKMAAIFKYCSLPILLDQGFHFHTYKIKVCE